MEKLSSLSSGGFKEGRLVLLIQVHKEEAWRKREENVKNRRTVYPH